VAPFNDIPSTRALIEAHSDDLAAIIVEPVMSSGGAIPADREYLEFLRSATRQCGALLIFDEVVTFRLAYGGAQEIYGITPDLTSLGKLIGGGFPVGGFGGRAEIMSWLDPSRQRLFQNGTFNGNAVTMAAGIAALELLTRAEIDRINRLGDRLRRGLANEFRAHGVDAQVSGLGSMLQIHLTAQPVIHYRSVAGLSRETQRMLHLSLLNRGIFAAPRNSMSISTAMGEQEVNEVIGAVADVLTEARQWVAAG
jgi:glutamate-1-semialdehyde 2,1-aminomutase